MDHDQLGGLVMLAVASGALLWCVTNIVYGVRHRGLGVLLDRRAYLFGDGRRRP